MDIANLIAMITGGNQRAKAMMTQALQVAQGIEQSKRGLLSYIQQNKVSLEAALPYLRSGPVRTVLDWAAPGAAPKLEAFGRELLAEQGASPAPHPHQSQPAAGKKFPPLKPKR